MVSLRSLAFVLGALGLALFLAGILWALMTPPDPACNGVKACERDSYGALLTNVMYVVGGGLLLEAGAVVMLLLHLSRGRAPPRQARPPPMPPRSPESPRNAEPSQNAGTPRNRFLEPPGPTRPGPPPRNGGPR